MAYARTGGIRLVYSEVEREGGSGLVESDLGPGSRFVVVEFQPVSEAEGRGRVSERRQ